MANLRPHWRLPTGVTRGLWEYFDSTAVAYDYDDYFAYNQLFEFDEQVLAEHFPQPGVVVDLGCGTGRALVPLARKGYQGVAVDLSAHMLDIVREKTDFEQLPILAVRGNLVEMDFLHNNIADYAICMFSTLGMIRGRAHRECTLKHVRRILKPGGVFVLHVHNYWYNFRDPGGPWWMFTSAVRSLLGSDWEAGDKYFSYRGVENMFLHVFTRRELKSSLRRAGFQTLKFIPLDPVRRRPLAHRWWLGDFRANGWIVVCQKTI